MSEEMLEIVDENDTVTGLRARDEIHVLGLRHREAYVWFVTPDQKVICQKRAANKDTFPGLLDTTVGGHVDPGENYLDCAIRETAEETGVSVTTDELVHLGVFDMVFPDEATNKVNCTFRSIYLYRYGGDVASLAVEAGKADGFVAISLDDIMAEGAGASGMIPAYLGPVYMPVWNKIKETL